jgi:hypothetical protein
VSASSRSRGKPLNFIEKRELRRTRSQRTSITSIRSHGRRSRRRAAALGVRGHGRLLWCQGDPAGQFGRRLPGQIEHPPSRAPYLHDSLHPGVLSPGWGTMATVNAKVCIYCKAGLTPTSRRAHVWPASMGGRLAPRDTSCDACNNALGPVEDNLRESLSHTFASVGATNDDRTPIEVTIEFAGREFILADGNAVMQVAGSHFDRETKSMIVPMPAGFDSCYRARPMMGSEAA